MRNPSLNASSQRCRARARKWWSIGIRELGPVAASALILRGQMIFHDRAIRQLHDKAIEQRSYFIWQREGCPEGKAIEHWMRAIAELQAEAGMPATAPYAVELKIMPRPRVSGPPHLVVSRRISEAPATVSAATR